MSSFYVAPVSAKTVSRVNKRHGLEFHAGDLITTRISSSCWRFGCEDPCYSYMSAGLYSLRPTSKEESVLDGTGTMVLEMRAGLTVGNEANLHVECPVHVRFEQCACE